MIREFEKEDSHRYFWVSNNVVYQTYKTSRGHRSRFICCVPFPDSDRLSKKEIDSIADYIKWFEYYFQ